jgi:hypothetical protein
MTTSNVVAVLRSLVAAQLRPAPAQDLLGV